MNGVTLNNRVYIKDLEIGLSRITSHEIDANNLKRRIKDALRHKYYHKYVFVMLLVTFAEEYL
jgi:hypothetical protein